MVLSGGGANALAHIGVLKALEENNIPIDYVTGTSMGALVGGFYAVGYSPDQIQQIFSSKEFQNFAAGDIEKYRMLYKSDEDNASMLTFKLNTDTTWEANLPTNLVSSSAINFALLSHFAPPITKANGSFDSLFVPFRCVASDIISKKQIVFKEGDLGLAIRASMAYPFYLKPVPYNNMLLFDGGLYNNFTSDIMCNDFNPELIIGSNVSYNFDLPDEDNVVSQLKAIVSNDTDYDIPCNKGILIEPEIGQNSTFDFENIDLLIAKGYEAAIQKIKEIKGNLELHREIDYNGARIAYRSSLNNLMINKIKVSGVSKSEESYIRKMVGSKKKIEPIQELKKNYLKTVNDEKIKEIIPSVSFNDSSTYYTLKLNVKKEKPLFVDVGGVFSNRPISEGYVGLKYNHLSKVALSFFANSYFGRFHNSLKTGVRMDLPFKLPLYIQSTYNGGVWDYYRSNNVFFEDKKPSFLVINDSYGKVEIGSPVFDKSKLVAYGSMGLLQNEYYQTKQFLSTDTADLTRYSNTILGAKFEHNSLNTKQYASKGTNIILDYKYVKGDERTILGSTAFSKEVFEHNVEWGQLKLSYQQYFNTNHAVRFGLFGEGVYSNQTFFSNYTASILAAPAFSVLTESKTIFQENLRAHNYIAGGVRNVNHISKNLQLRIEGYVFQPYQAIFSNEDQTAYYGEKWRHSYFICSSTLAYTTPIGPIAVNVNYYNEAQENWTFMFHFGYVIFNKKSLD